MDGNGHNPPVPSTLVTVTVTFDVVTRECKLSAPINDEMVLLHMLEKARDAVKKLVAEQGQGQRVVGATTMPPPPPQFKQ
jgi:hypothetical protein